MTDNIKIKKKQIAKNAELSHQDVTEFLSIPFKFNLTKEIHEMDQETTKACHHCNYQNFLNDAVATVNNSQVHLYKLPRHYLLDNLAPHFLRCRNNTNTLPTFLSHLLKMINDLQNCVKKSRPWINKNKPKLCIFFKIISNFDTELIIFKGFNIFSSNLSFLHFDVLYSPACNVDKISVYDGLNRSLGDYCGKLPPWNLYSYHNTVFLKVTKNSNLHLKTYVQFQAIQKNGLMSNIRTRFGNVIARNWTKHLKQNIGRSFSLSNQVILNNLGQFIIDSESIAFYWMWQGFPGSMTKVNIRKQFLTGILYIYAGLTKNIKSYHYKKEPTYTIKGSVNTKKLEIFHFLVGIRLKILRTIHLYHTLHFQIYIKIEWTIPDNFVLPVKLLDPIQGSSNFSKQFTNDDNDFLYIVSRYSIANKLTTGQTKYLTLDLEINGVKYHEDNCPLFGVYIHDGDFEKRHQYHYMMGPYCGQNNYPVNDAITLKLTAFTPNLTIVVYSFLHHKYLKRKWNVTVLNKRSGSFIAVINPCSAIPHYCSWDYIKKHLVVGHLDYLPYSRIW